MIPLAFARFGSKRVIELSGDEAREAIAWIKTGPLVGNATVEFNDQVATFRIVKKATLDDGTPSFWTSKDLALLSNPGVNP